jgi:hypothetical protein
VPWYFRRSFGRGPLRLNLSRRGLGVSVGVKGFRVGTGPRGAYIRAGRGGFYYQQYLSAAARPLVQGHVPHVPPDPDQTVLGEPVEFVGEVERTSDAYIAELNRRRKQLRWSSVLFLVSGAMFVWAIAKGAAAPWYVLLVGALLATAFLRRRENVDRAIELMYDLEGEVAERYSALCSAFQQAASSTRTWRLATTLSLSEGRRHAGARSLVTRTRMQLVFGGGGDVRTNVLPPVIPLKAARVYFLPDRLLAIAGSRVTSLAYPVLQVGAEQDNFREDGSAPSDATLVGMTWVYVNNNGTPDRRFKNNRRIPIYAYSELKVNHTSLSFIVQFSKQNAAVPITEALRRLS